MKERITNFLKKKKRKPGWRFYDAPDEREPWKVTHKVWSLHNALVLGLATNKPTLRDVESMTRCLRLEYRGFVPSKISDTKLDEAVRCLDVEYLTGKLVQQVREDFRAKMLDPVFLPCGVATVDGKNLATLDHDADGIGHARSKENEKWQKSGKSGAYFLYPALRASLTSAESRSIILQRMLPAGCAQHGRCLGGESPPERRPS